MTTTNVAGVARLTVNIPRPIHLAATRGGFRPGAYELVAVRAGHATFESVIDAGDGRTRTWFRSSRHSKDASSGSLLASLTGPPRFVEHVAALETTRSAREAIALASRVDHAGAARYAEGEQPGVTSLTEIGQRVMLAPKVCRKPEEAGQAFEIVEIEGEGDDAFVALKGADGVIRKWFRSTELLPAANAVADPAYRVLPRKDTTVKPTKTTDSAAQAAAFEQRVTELATARPWASAIAEATAADPQGARAYALMGGVAEVSAASPALSLSNDPTAGSFDALVAEYANKHKTDLRTAIHDVSLQHPALAARR